MRDERTEGGENGSKSGEEEEREVRGRGDGHLGTCMPSPVFDGPEVPSFGNHTISERKRKLTSEDQGERFP